LVQAAVHQDVEAVENSLRDLRSEKLDDKSRCPLPAGDAGAAEGKKDDVVDAEFTEVDRLDVA
jgi:hypothetical protein